MALVSLGEADTSACTPTAAQSRLLDRFLTGDHHAKRSLDVLPGLRKLTGPRARRSWTGVFDHVKIRVAEELGQTTLFKMPSEPQSCAPEIPRRPMGEDSMPRETERRRDAVADHWRKLRSTNPLQRVNREIGDAPTWSASSPTTPR
jgi:hypothetical protein